MIVLEQIAREVLRILMAHGHHPIGGISIGLTVQKRDFNTLQIVSTDSTSRFQSDTYGEIRDEGKIEELWWDCTLSYSRYSGPYVRMPAVKDKQLKAIMEDLAASFKSINVPVPAYQVIWGLEAADFNDKFTGHPNLLVDVMAGIQASEPIEGMYCSIQIIRGFETNDFEAASENTHAKQWEVLQFQKGQRQDSPAEDDFLLGDELIKYLWQQLPAELDQLIRQVSDAVKRDPEHQLLPGKRKQIYDLIAAYPGGDSALKWLAAFTVLRTIYYWHEQTPEMFRPFMLLTLARNALEGKADRVQMVQTAHAARSYYEDLEGAELDTRVIYAGVAAAEALLRVTGLDRWAEISISDKVTDDALDWSTSDVAKWAVSAYAGGTKRFGTKEVNLEKRLEFWIWWLEEAIPAAWSTVAA